MGQKGQANTCLLCVAVSEQSSRKRSEAGWQGKQWRDKERGDGMEDSPQWGRLGESRGSPFWASRQLPAWDDVGDPGVVIAKTSGRKEKNLKWVQSGVGGSRIGWKRSQRVWELRWSRSIAVEACDWQTISSASGQVRKIAVWEKSMFRLSGLLCSALFSPPLNKNL